MKLQTFFLSDITFIYTPYSESLKESLIRMGQGFPIQVRKQADGTLQCVDGHKRCSALSDLARTNHKYNVVQAVLLNTARSESGTTRNFH